MLKPDVFGAFRSANPLGVVPESCGLADWRPSHSCPTVPFGSVRAGVADSEEKRHRVDKVTLRGRVPEYDDDGFVSDYDVSEYKIFYYPWDSTRTSRSTELRKPISRQRREGGYRVFFVNGMQGNPWKFKAQACATAAVSGGPVTAVFNAGGHFLEDLWQCATDKMFSNDWLNMKVESKKFLARSFASEMSQPEIDAYVLSELRDSNIAAARLCEELLSLDDCEARIVAHSQGNIIACNAINGVYAARGRRGIRNIRMYAVASPVVFWSKAVSCLERGAELQFQNDLVTWLGLNWGDKSYLQGWSATGEVGETEIPETYERRLTTLWNVATHSFYIYLEHYWRVLQRHFE